MRFRYPPPKNENDFEYYCLLLLRRHWDAPGLELYGRRGESQDGVDIIDLSGHIPLRAAQCKLHEFHKPITPGEISSEVEKAKKFPRAIGLYAILTTGKVSTRPQQRVRKINEAHGKAGLFSVELITWNQIEDLLDQYADVRDRIYPRGGVRPSQLPAPVGDFVGREKEIKTLVAALRNRDSVAISGINGMGGIGKTELAVLVASRLKADYPDAQLFINMRGTDDPPRDPADALKGCIRDLTGPEVDVPEEIEPLATRYRECLDGKRAIVLLDNVGSAEQLWPLRPPGGCVLIVTSREKLAFDGLAVSLDELSVEEARDLLTGIVARPKLTAEVAEAASARVRSW